ncbi:MAG: MFS transporter [Planctomycetia bacterium]|nr:MFS transporter [Planctomycetia bacterium]
MSEKKVSPWLQTSIAAMTSYIDAGSIVAIGAGLSLWESYLGLSRFQVGLLTAFSSNALGAAIGALLGGMLCDRWGRKFVYTYDLILYMLGMLLVVFGLHYGMLFVGFMMVGIAVGADVVASWTLIAEQAPAQNRARHCGAAQFAWALGPAVVLMMSVGLGLAFQSMANWELVSHWNGKEIQWGNYALLANRIVFGHLIVVAFITWLLRLRMPESENWKAAKAREKALEEAGEKKKSAFRELLLPVNVKTVLFLCGVYVIWNLCAGTMGILMPYIYENVCQISNTMSCALTIIIFLTSTISTLLIFMWWGDRWSRRWIYFAMAALFVLAWSLFLLPAAWITLPVLILFAVLVGINNGSGQQAFYQLWCSELFPARYRASAQGFTFFAARITVGIWTALVPMIMASSYGFPLAAKCMVGFALFSLLVGTLYAPDTSGKTLEQIERERYGEKGG